jgi:hypothetical protein
MMTDNEQLEATVRAILANSPRWNTIGQLVYEIASNYSLTLAMSRRQVYGAVRTIADRLVRQGIAQRALGADDGREVRVYRCA